MHTICFRVYTNGKSKSQILAVNVNKNLVSAYYHQMTSIPIVSFYIEVFGIFGIPFKERTGIVLDRIIQGMGRFDDFGIIQKLQNIVNEWKNERHKVSVSFPELGFQPHDLMVKISNKRLRSVLSRGLMLRQSRIKNVKDILIRASTSRNRNRANNWALPKCLTQYFVDNWIF